MKYQLYQLNSNGDLVTFPKDSSTSFLDVILLKIENEMIFEFKKKQKGKIGITNLGDELRRNKRLNEIFESPSNNRIIIKLTGNRMSFLKIFINSINEFSKLEIYFFILEGEFGKYSNLVDKTFIKVQDISRELKILYNNFKSTRPALSIYFIEMVNFENCFIENSGKYAFLHSV
jgi:hypothetical protein